MWMTDLIHKIVVKMCEKKISNVKLFGLELKEAAEKLAADFE